MCEGRRWHLWDEDECRWKRTTVGYFLSHRIVREVERLIVEAVMEDRCEDAGDWCRHLNPTDVDTRFTPYMSRVYRETETLPRWWK